MRVACLLDTDFEDSEYRQPREQLTGAGHDVVVIGREGGATLTGKKGDVTARVDMPVGEARPEAFEALLIPGGYSPDHLRADLRFVAFTRAFFDDVRPVFAVCHGPQLLITARVVQGRRMTAWVTIQDDLRQVGADVVDEEVVVDGNLVTSRQPADLEAFSRAAVAMLDAVPARR